MSFRRGRAGTLVFLKCLDYISLRPLSCTLPSGDTTCRKESVDNTKTDMDVAEDAWYFLSLFVK